MNFVFISPNFPQNYWQFCDRLSRNGVNVLGIGDSPYDDLPWELKNALTEYYKVDTLEDYDAVFRAVAFSRSNTARSTGSSPTTSTGLPTTQGCVRTST